MKREIKFRAWDNLENRWYEPTFEGYRGKIEEIMLSPRGRLTMRTMTELIDESMFPNRFEIMQYTGLKDKNGGEIYEGDIVRTGEDNIGDPESMIGQVIMREGSWLIENEKMQEAIELFSEITSREVIGNIFEDKQLLEGKYE